MPKRKIIKFINEKWPTRAGDALILTMFMMAGMLIVALSGVYIVLLGLKAAGVQSQSTRAYFAAEAGAEDLIYQVRKNGCVTATTSCAVISTNPGFSGNLGTGGTTENYQVYYTGLDLSTTPKTYIFESIGEYNNVRRNVEIRIQG